MYFLKEGRASVIAGKETEKKYSSTVLPAAVVYFIVVLIVARGRQTTSCTSSSADLGSLIVGLEQRHHSLPRALCSRHSLSTIGGPRHEGFSQGSVDEGEFGSRRTQCRPVAFLNKE